MDSELGLGHGAHRSRRSQSLHDKRDHAPSLTIAAPSISCTDLRYNGRAARAAPSFCPRHVPPYVCSRRQCTELHLCRLFLDGFCPREDAACRWGHMVKSADNWHALESYQLQAAPEDELLWLARSLIRRIAPVSAEEYRRELVLCEKYSANARCGRRDCLKIHLCPRLVEGKCQASTRCRWSHRLDDPDNIMVLLRLKCSDLAEDEVLVRLARQPGDGHETDTSSGVVSELTTSSVSGRAAGSSYVENGEENTESSDSPSHGSDHEMAVSSRHVDSQLTASFVSMEAGGLCHRDVGARGTGEENADILSARSGASGMATCTSTPLKSSADSQVNQFSTEGAYLLTSLDLCPWNIHPSVCSDSACSNLHLCRLHVAGMCPYGEKCSSGHKLCNLPHNSDVLKRHMLLDVTEADVLKGLREGYLRRHPILLKERQMAVQACRRYQSGNCSQSDCPRLHICLKYARGTCQGQDVCELSHKMDTETQVEIVRRTGLYPLSVEELRNIFKKPVVPKDVHSELVSGSSEIAIEERGNLVQTQMQSCAPLLNTSSSLPRAPFEHSGIRQQVEYQTSEDILETGSAPEGITSQTTVGHPTGDMVGNVGTSLDLCHQNIRPAICLDEDCRKLHVCRLFVAGVCPYGKRCGRGHNTCSSKHNKIVLAKHGITGVSEEDLLKNLRSGYLSRNPLTDAERHSALQVCRPYQTGRCKLDNCLRLHVCTDFVTDGCIRDCGLSHQISSSNAVLKRLGLSSLCLRDILVILQESASLLKKYPGPTDTAVNAGQSENHDKIAAPGPTKDPCSSLPYIPQSSTQPQGDTSRSVVLDSLQTVTANSDRLSSMLCDVHASGGCCDRADCNGFHVCGYFLADVCRRADESCPLGHTFQTEHNVRVMQIRGLAGNSANDFQRLLEDIVLRARVAFKNGAHKRVESCLSYNSLGGCAVGNDCKRFHICHRFLAGSCPEARCSLSHNLSGYHNKRVRADFGLGVKASEHQDVVWASDRDLIELIRAKMSLRPGTYPTEQPATTLSGNALDLTNSSTSSDPHANSTLPPLCERYGTVVGCSDADCALLHVCPHFLASSCHDRRCRPCPLEHRLSSLHNQEVFRRTGRTLKGANYKKLSKMLYDSSPHVRRTELYQKLRLCSPHNQNGCWLPECVCIHICRKFIVGTCPKSEGCVKGHTVNGADNLKRLQALGLGDASADEVLEMLRAIHSGPSVSPDAVNLDESDYEPRETKGNLPTSGIHLSVSEKPLSCETSTAEAQPASGFSTVLPCVDEPLPVVCQQHSSISGCSDANCSAVHICPHFLSASCRRSDCPLGHLLTTAHNRQALRHAVPEVNDLNHDVIVKMLYDASPHIRRTAVYQKLRLCAQHVGTKGCAVYNCLKIHLCHSYLAGVCMYEKCRKGHQLDLPWNKTKLLVNGLEDASTEEVLEMLRAIYGCRSLCAGSLVLGEPSSPPSGDGPVDVKAAPSFSDVSAAGHAGPTVCRQYATIAGCSDAKCTFVHVCPHFVAGSCRRGKACQLGHELDSEHNEKVLRLAGHEAFTETDVADLVKMMYANSSHIQRTELYQKLRVCALHNSKSLECQREACEFIHVCSPFIAGTCKAEFCSRDHDIHSARNKSSLDQIGLKTASSDEVLEMLRAVHAWRSMCRLLSTRNSRPADDCPASEKSAPTSTADYCSANDNVTPPLTANDCTAPEKVTSPCNAADRPVIKKVVAPPTADDCSATKKATSPPTADDCPAREKVTPPSSGDSGSKKDVPVVCQRYGTVAGCFDAHCSSVHICPHRLAQSCRRRKHCLLEHSLDSQHNREALRLAGYETTTEHVRADLIKAMYASSPHIPRTEVYKKLRVCVDYNRKGRTCQDETCPFIHVCPAFVFGVCRKEACPKDHDIQSSWNRTNLGRIGLAAASPDEVLEMLRAILCWPTVCDLRLATAGTSDDC